MKVVAHMTNGKEQTNSEQLNRLNKPRNAFVAFIFSLFFPGLGQVYNGQIKKAIVFLGVLILIPVLWGITRITTFFYGLLSLFLIEIFLHIYFIIDGVRYARKQKNYALKKYNIWYVYCIIGIVGTNIWDPLDIDSVLGIQYFRTPSTANSPTFKVGDLLVADLKAYENKNPDYGDIVTFKRDDGQIYTFRITGKPNDNIEMKDNIVTINGKPCKTKFIREITFDQVPVCEFEEELPNGHKHSMYINKQPFINPKSDIGNILVPSDYYFVLGDNRDNAVDSRYEGFVNKKEILGRIIYSYWGHTMDRIHIDFRDK